MDVEFFERVAVGGEGAVEFRVGDEVVCLYPSQVLKPIHKLDHQRRLNPRIMLRRQPPKLIRILLNQPLRLPIQLSQMKHLIHIITLQNVYHRRLIIVLKDGAFQFFAFEGVDYIVEVSVFEKFDMKIG